MKNKWILLLFVFCNTLLNVSCVSSHKHKLSESAYEKIYQKDNHEQKDYIVYYFDGDCSLCIAKSKFIEQHYSSKLYPVFIAKTLNPDILKFNWETSKINSKVVIDSTSSYYKYLIFNQVIKVSSDRSYEIIDLK